MNKSTFDLQPSLINYEGEQVQINFDIEQVEETIPSAAQTTEQESGQDGQTAQTRTVFKAYSVRLRHPLTRSRIIDAIITAAYPSDVMQAIVNNHLLDPSDEDHEAEFQAMQEWRTKAKAVAKQVLEA